MLLQVRGSDVPGRTLTIETVTVTQPQRLGDPVQVKGSLQGIAFKEAK